MNNSTSLNVTNLLPYRSYVFTVYTEAEGVENLSEPAISKPFQTGTEGITKTKNDMIFTIILSFLQSHVFLQHHIHLEELHSVASHQVLCT